MLGSMNVCWCYCQICTTESGWTCVIVVLMEFVLFEEKPSLTRQLGGWKAWEYVGHPYYFFLLSPIHGDYNSLAFLVCLLLLPQTVTKSLFIITQVKNLALKKYRTVKEKRKRKLKFHLCRSSMGNLPDSATDTAQRKAFHMSHVHMGRVRE